jgi:hypothetical protein
VLGAGRAECDDLKTFNLPPRFPRDYQQVLRVIRPSQALLAYLHPQGGRLNYAEVGLDAIVASLYLLAVAKLYMDWHLCRRHRNPDDPVWFTDHVRYELTGRSGGGDRVPSRR